MSEPKLFIYHLDRGLASYDEYSDCVVISSSEEQARKIHPKNCYNLHIKLTKEEKIKNNDFYWIETDKSHTRSELNPYGYSEWCLSNKTDDLKITLLGESSSKYEEYDVICASYHAG